MTKRLVCITCSGKTESFFIDMTDSEYDALRRVAKKSQHAGLGRPFMETATEGEAKFDWMKKPESWVNA